MICKTCEELLALYERSVRLYTNSVHNLTGMLGDDFARTFEEAERLKLACGDASETLMTHWRQTHSNLAISTQA